MVKLVLGAKGKGKTKYMLDNANSEAKNSDGVVIYLDKNAKHMFELDRRIRLVNVSEYFVLSAEALIGFISGLVAGNSDIEAIYFDSFLTLVGYEGSDLADLLDKFVVLSQTLNVDFIISLSMDEHELPEQFKEYVVLSL
ncbi:MAG: twitching motility protein PilT [Lachnospiraceae bacterium]|nr:twitching motility protein PilT [Lachnospiraceae bacterium]